MKDVKKTIELITNVAIILVCALIGWSYLTHKSLALHVSQPRDEAAATLKGLTLSPLPGYRWDAHTQTLVVGLRVGCHFCQESLPFYKQLSDLEKSNRLRAHILAVFPDNQNSSMSFLRPDAIVLDSISNQSLSTIHVSATPTLLLVNSAGRIVDAWVGELPASDEQKLVALLKQ